MFDLTEGLIRRKYTDRDIELILGGNFKRVLADVGNVSAVAEHPGIATHAILFRSSVSRRRRTRSAETGASRFSGLRAARPT